MAALLDRTRDVDADLSRNIVSLRASTDLFDDLSDGEPRLARTAAAAEMRVKGGLEAGVIARGYHYSTAVEYPFVTEPYLESRYGDGSFGVWYGALDARTTVYEAAYHMIRDEGRIEGLNEEVVRERAVYDVRCRAALIDLSGKRRSHPELIGDDYASTQGLARRLVDEGHPGLLAPSARCAGTVAAVFNIKVLRDAHLDFYLTYRLDPRSSTVQVERTPGTPWLALQWRNGRIETL